MDMLLMEAVEVKYRELMEDLQEKAEKKDNKGNQILAMAAKIAALEAAVMTTQKPPARPKADKDQPNKEQCHSHPQYHKRAD